MTTVFSYAIFILNCLLYTIFLSFICFPVASYTTNMAVRYSLINRITQIGQSDDSLILKLRVVREYKLYARGNTNQILSYEIVCHDRNGDRIHGTIRPADFRRFKLKFVVGTLYAFHHFDVKDNDMRFRTTTSMFRFVSTPKTIFGPIIDSTFPSYMFVLRPFSAMLDRAQLVENLLVGMFFFKMYIDLHFNYIMILYTFM